MADILNPLAQAGFSLTRLIESPTSDPQFWEDGFTYLPGTDSDLLDWRENPHAALPVWLTVAARKPDS